MGDTLSRAGKHLAAIRLIREAGNRREALQAFLTEYEPTAALVHAARGLRYEAEVELGIAEPPIEI